MKVNVSIEGANEVIRAAGKLPADAKTELREQAFDIAKVLTDRMKASGRRHSRQAARAASTVREVRGAFPTIQASNSGRARGFLFGSVFGMKRKSGWYAKRRYFDSRGQQFGPYVGYPGYWFFKDAEDSQGYVEGEWAKVADNVVQKWGA